MSKQSQGYDPNNPNHNPYDSATWTQAPPVYNPYDSATWDQNHGGVTGGGQQQPLPPPPPPGVPAPPPIPQPGGGGGGGGAPAGPDPVMEEMLRQEQARIDAEAAAKAERDANNAAINKMFDDRQPAYDQYADDLYSHNMESYNANAEKARNQTKFALARTGNTGGSVDADTSGSLESLYQEGLTNLRSGSQDAANQLKAQENQQRNAMLQHSASGNYSAAPQSATFGDTGMTTMSAGVGNQFQSLLGGIGGASTKWNGGKY